MQLFWSWVWCVWAVGCPTSVDQGHQDTSPQPAPGRQLSRRVHGQVTSARPRKPQQWLWPAGTADWAQGPRSPAFRTPSYTEMALGVNGPSRKDKECTWQQADCCFHRTYSHFFPSVFLVTAHSGLRNVRRPHSGECAHCHYPAHPWQKKTRVKGKDPEQSKNDFELSNFKLLSLYNNLTN